MLTRDIQELIVSGVTFLVMGMFLGNLILIVLGMFPIVFLALGILIGQPREVIIERQGEDQKIWVDNQVTDTITATVRGGVGPVTFSDVLPESFRLEDGTNFKVLWIQTLKRTTASAFCLKFLITVLRQMAAGYGR